MARPSKYTDELAMKLCAEVSSGKPLTTVCRDDEELPDPSTVRRWLLGNGIPSEKLDGFRALYAEAREMQAETYFDELHRRAIECPEDRDYIAKEKLLSDNVKWSLARMNRAKYGDHSSHELTGQGGSEIRFSWKEPEDAGQ